MEASIRRPQSRRILGDITHSLPIIFFLNNILWFTFARQISLLHNHLQLSPQWTGWSMVENEHFSMKSSQPIERPSSLVEQPKISIPFNFTQFNNFCLSNMQNHFRSIGVYFGTFCYFRRSAYSHKKYSQSERLSWRGYHLIIAVWLDSSHWKNGTHPNVRLQSSHPRTSTILTTILTVYLQSRQRSLSSL